MVAFSKPIQDGDLDLPTKRKRTINPKLLDNDNMSSDAVKRRKLEALKFNQTSGPLASSSQSIAATTSSPETGAHLSSTAPSAPSTSAPSTHQASVEIVEDDDDHFRPNAGIPKNPETILESVHDDMEFTPPVARKREAKKKQTGVVDESSDKEPGKKETDDKELGKLNLLLLLIRHLICSLECLQRDWRSKIYAFFNSEVKIKYPDGRNCHEFTCSAKYCKGKGKNPVTSIPKTGHQRKVFGHMPSTAGVQKSWRIRRRPRILHQQGMHLRRRTCGMDQLRLYLNEWAKERLHTHIDPTPRMRLGAFVYLNTCDTWLTSDSCEIVKWVAQSMRPFSIVEDEGFKMLMKTGRLNHYM